MPMVSHKPRGIRSSRRREEADLTEKTRNCPPRYLGGYNLASHIALARGHNRQGHIKCRFIEVHDDFHRVQPRFVNDVERDVRRFEILSCVLLYGPLVGSGVKKTCPGIAQQYFHSVTQVV